MADNVIRKACDRCHTQKLCCKRVGDQPCERCTRLRTECKSSPSLRYKKQHQKHHSSQTSQQKQKQPQSQSKKQRQPPPPLQPHPQPQPQPQPQQQPQQQPPQQPPQHQPQQQPQQQPQPPPEQQQQEDKQQQPQQQHPPQESQAGYNIQPAQPELQQQDNPQQPHQQHQQQDQQEQHDQHQHPQQQPQPQQQPPSAKTVEIRSRSPKRRRTDSDPRLVLPDTGLSHTSVVTPDQAVDGVGGGEFNFNFEQLELFATGTAAGQTESLSLPLITNRVEDFHHHHHHPGSGVFVAADSWNPHHNEHQHQHQHLQHPHQHQHLLPPPSSEAFTGGVTPASVFSQHPGHLTPSSPALPGPLTGRSGISHSGHTITVGTGGPEKRQKSSRPRHTRRQITLRQTALRQAIHFNARETSTVSWMAQLSDINGRLLDLSSKLSQVQEIAQNGAGALTDANGIPTGFPIDQMFQITREVADILDQLVSTTLGDDANRARQVRQDVADPANAMLVLSIYVRLLDMYQHVFDLVQAEVSQTIPSPDSAFRFWKLPDVTVGSFAVESSPSLQMSLTIQLAEDFLTRLSGATASVNASIRNGDVSQPPDGFAGAIEGSYEAVKGKEEHLHKHLVQLRAEIEALLDD